MFVWRPALIEAFDGHRVDRPEDAAIRIAVVDDIAMLDSAIREFAAADFFEADTERPVWIVHGKGPRASLGEGAVRAHMRAARFKDDKASAVSDTLSATRYSRSRPAS